MTENSIRKYRIATLNSVSEHRLDKICKGRIVYSTEFHYPYVWHYLDLTLINKKPRDSSLYKALVAKYNLKTKNYKY